MSKMRDFIDFRHFVQLKWCNSILRFFHKGISIAEAINRIYRSKLYKKLSTESTKYWHLGPVDLYEELKQEL